MDRKLLFIVLSLACVSLAASSWVSRPTSIERKPFRWSPDQTYVYEYRGRLVNGIPKLADQYAGLEIEADLFLQPIDGKQVVMRLDDIKIDQLHSKLDEHYEVSADKLAHDDAKTPNRDNKKSIYDDADADDESTIDRELLIEYTKELSKPIKFLYVNGKVEQFEAESSDKEWSVNMKKSILALFQLDLVPNKIIKAPSVYRNINSVNGISQQAEQQLQQDISTIVDPATGRRVGAQYSAESVISAGELPLVYPVYEEGFGGICETEYQVDSNENPDTQSLHYNNKHHQQQRSQQQWESDKFVSIANVLNVTKTINFKNCLTDPSVSYDGHKFTSSSEQSSLWGSLLEKKTQPLAGYYPVPEELKAKYSKLNAAYNEKSTADQITGPVERYAFVKYNISQWQQTNGEQVSLIESAFAEGKIKYRAEGDEFVSVSHQYLKLVTVKQQSSTSTTAAQRLEGPKQPIVYETIQSELKDSKQKYYESVMRHASINGVRTSINSNTGYTANINTVAQQQMPEFAQSASWYSLVANVLNNKNKDAIEPEQMGASIVHLIDSLATDVLTEDLEQSKKAGDKVVQIVNLVSLMPKYKLIELYEQLARPAEQQQQRQQQVSLKSRIVRKLFLDSLPLSGSKHAIALIAELIEAQRCTVSEAKEMVEAVPSNLRFPDTEIIDAFIRVAQNAAVRKQRQLFSSCSLACAKMIKNAYEQTKTSTYKSTALDQQQLPQHLADDLAASIIAAEADPRQQQTKMTSPTTKFTPQQQGTDSAMADKELDDEDLTRYVKYYKQMLDKATQYYEKVVYMETLAHMGVPHVLPILEPYVSGRLSLQQCLGASVSHHQAAPLTSQQLARRQQWTYRTAYTRWAQQQQQQSPLTQQQLSSWSTTNDDKTPTEWNADIGMDAEECNHMRTLTIYALAHIARDHPSLVLPLVLPVFENTFEPYQVRIAAFTSAILSQADEHQLERIASQMWREPNQEVVSFVTGTLATLANMTSPAFERMSSAARKAFESMPQQYVEDWRRSWLSGADHYNGEAQTSLSWIAEIVKSNVSVVPRAGYVELMRSHGPNGEHADQLVQIGFAAKGIENVLRDFVGVNSDEISDSSEYAIKRTGDESTDDSILTVVFDNLFNGADELSQWWDEIREAYDDASDDETIKRSIKSSWSKKQQQESHNNKSGKQFTPKGKLATGSSKPLGASLKEKLSSQYTRQQQQQWIYGKRRQAEEPKLAIFAKLFDSTAYYALDKKQMQQILNQADSYLLEMASELMHGHKMQYVKMMMPASMWHMTPSQLGLPVFVTHREPLIVSIAAQGVTGGQQESTTTTTTGRNTHQQQQRGNNNQINVIAHPKIMHSNVRFMFAVDCVAKQAYGVTTNKVHQVSLPFEVSVEYSRSKHLVSVALAPKTPKEVALSTEIAKTFIGEVRLDHTVVRNWLGAERQIRDDAPERSTPIKMRWDSAKELAWRSGANPLGLDLQVDIVSDDDEFDWSFDMSDAEQHRKSGPMSQLLHAIDALSTRQCKYQEVRVNLKPDAPNKQPVYRFDIDLETKSVKHTTKQLEGEDAKRPFGRRAGPVTDESVREQQDKQVWMRSSSQPSTTLSTSQESSTNFVGSSKQQQQQQQQQPRQQVSTIRRNVILEKSGDNKICVSTVPVEVCPVISVPEQVSQKTEIVAFHCFDKRTDIGEQMYERYVQQQQEKQDKQQTLSGLNDQYTTTSMRSMPYVSSMDSHSYERQDVRQQVDIPRTCYVY